MWRKWNELIRKLTFENKNCLTKRSNSSQISKSIVLCWPQRRNITSKLFGKQIFLILSLFFDEVPWTAAASFIHIISKLYCLLPFIHRCMKWFRLKSNQLNRQSLKLGFLSDQLMVIITSHGNSSLLTTLIAWRDIIYLVNTINAIN